MRKKILFVTTALWIGGIETALVNLLNHIDYAKYEVTLLVLKAELNLLDKVNPNCKVIVIDRNQCVTFKQPYKHIRLYNLTENSAHPSWKHRMLMWTVPVIKWIENKLFIRYVQSLMHGQKYDTCVIYSDVVAEIAVMAVKANKYLMFYHHGAMRRVYHDNIGYKKSSKIIAVSDNQAIALRNFVPQYAAKIVSIHNLTDIETIITKSEEDIAERFEEAFFNIVSVGRVSHEKGMDIAVYTCAELVHKGFTTIRWWIVGDGPAMDEVNEAIRITGMEKYVITVGMKSNPYPYIKKADLYVQPSRFEGYPMTILESLILGQPVISTNNNGAREIIRDGITGLLTGFTTSSISEVIEGVLLDRKILSSLKENVRSIDFVAENNDYMRQLEEQL